MAKNETPDFETEDSSPLDDLSAREAKKAKLDSILGKNPGRVGAGIDMTPQTAEEAADDRRIRMEERHRKRMSRIEADLGKMATPKPGATPDATPAVMPAAIKQQPARKKDNSVMRALREGDNEPSSEPSAPLTGEWSTSSEAGDWFRSNPSAVEGLREMGRAIDPNAAALHRARTSGRGTVFEFGSREHVHSFDPTSGSNAQDVVGNERIGGMGGIMSGNENAAISTDYDPADTGPRVFGGPAFAEPAKIASPFEKFRETAPPDAKLAANVGTLYLRQAGRCNHPLCQMKRARGLELMGRPVSNRQFGKGIESPLPAIPSVATQKREYPINPQTGKQDRKNPTTFLEVRPADPKGIEWQHAQSLLDTNEANLFMPEDLLEHHHGPEDMDFERHIPWHPNYKGPQ